MRKFRLIKKYPGSGEIGAEVEIYKDGIGYTGSGEKCPRMHEVVNFPEYWKEIIEIPEYVEAIKSSRFGAFIKGKIYKVKELRDSIYMIEEDSNGNKDNGWHIRFFKPSTKEAFDKQKGIIICGHKVEKFDENASITYKIGCKYFKRNELLTIKRMIIMNRFLSVSFDGYTVLLSEIEQILEM